jgi:hypothetical protein
MSGLFKRLSSRRSAGPEGTEPPTAAEPGTTDAPATTPAEPEGRQPLFTDPAAPTSVLREGDPLTEFGPPAEVPAPDPNAQTLFDPNAHAVPVEPAPVAAPVEPNPYVAPIAPPALVAYQPPAGPGVPVVPVADLPAGLDPDELTAAPGTSARRGKLRRRIAFLRAARELLLRDLGGFVYELHRTAHDVEHEAHRRLRETKLARLSRVDAELHELEIRLDDVRRQVLVREPGVGGECPHCGELFSSAAHYCSNCGLPLTEGARRELARSQQQVPATAPTPEPPVALEPPPVVAHADQPTQEIPSLDPDHPDAGADFQWPRRDDTKVESSWASTPSGLAPEAEAAASGEATPGAEAVAPAEAAASDEPTPEAAAETPAAAATSDQPTPEAAAEVTAGDAPTPEAEAETPADAATNDAPTPEAAAPSEVAASDEPTPETEAAVPAEVAASDEPTPQAEAETPPEATPSDEPAPPEPDAAPADEATPEPVDGEAGQAQNGSVHDNSILRPVERRP